VVKVVLAFSLLITGASPVKAPGPTTPRTAPVFRDYETEISATGLATWYNANRNGQTTWYTRKGIKDYGAAGPGLRAMVPERYGQYYDVIVTNLATGISVKVHVVDWCSCWGYANNDADDRLIDLAPSVFKSLGTPLGVGVMKIKITLVREDNARN
jgi:rare lipoprotein A (peptidoglycan hydrolase)